MQDRAVLKHKKDQVTIIQINRPDQRNAINDEVRSGLFEAFNEFENDPNQRVAILTASGDKAFCAGMDLKMMSDMPAKPLPRDYLPVIGRSIHLSKPTICAVNGIAVAGGWLFAQMCDLCIASDNAKFGITEAKVGRGMPWAAPLINMLPQRVMMEILLTGDLIDAQRAFEIGFVNQVVESDDLLDRALEIARKIIANAPLTVQAARDLVYMSTEMGRTAALDMADYLFDGVYRSEDAIEGPTAFKEKRDPIWKGY